MDSTLQPHVRLSAKQAMDRDRFNSLRSCAAPPLASAKGLSPHHLRLTQRLVPLVLPILLSGCQLPQSLLFLQPDRVSQSVPSHPDPVQELPVDGERFESREAHSGSNQRERSARLAFEQAIENRSTGRLSGIHESIPLDQPEPDASVSTAIRLGPGPSVSGSSDVVQAATHESVAAVSVLPPDELSALEAQAVAENPALVKLQREVQSAWSAASYRDKLPDPTLGATVFGRPIETAAGSYRANLMVSQMIPWLERLDAQSQQAWCEAMMRQQQYLAARLRVVAEVRMSWYQLFVLGQQISTARANQQILKGLIDVASSRLATGSASRGDVSLATLELARLEQRLVDLRAQVAGVRARLNRLTGRPAEAPLRIPTELSVSLPNWTHAGLRQQAWEQQPSVAAANLEARATRWGVEVARLRERPDVSLSAAWYGIDENRPSSPVVDVGRDAWSFGAQVSIPLWQDKYSAIRDEATWKHLAAHASTEQLMQEIDEQLRSLWEEARAADETATLYQATIIPEARQSFESDQQLIADGTVEFDRLMNDFRNLLTLELEYHRARGRLAIALARIRQLVGSDRIAGDNSIEPPPGPAPPVTHDPPAVE